MDVQEKETLIKEISTKQPDIAKYKKNSRKWMIGIIVGAVIACAPLVALIAIFSIFGVPDVVVGSTMLIIVFLINPMEVLLMGKVVYDKRKAKTEEMLDKAYKSVIVLRKYFEKEGTDASGAFFGTMTLDELSEAAEEAEKRMRKSKRKKGESKKEAKEKADES